MTGKKHLTLAKMDGDLIERGMSRSGTAARSPESNPASQLLGAGAQHRLWNQTQIARVRDPIEVRLLETFEC